MLLFITTTDQLQVATNVGDLPSAESREEAIAEPVGADPRIGHQFYVIRVDLLQFVGMIIFKVVP